MKTYKKIIIPVIFIFIAVLAISYFQPVSALSRLGSRGEEVKQIQTKLKDMGLYTGSVDGIFGPLTLQAVKKFQSNNGLVVDGIAGPKTLAKLGLTSSSGDSNRDANLELLAKIISAEAKGEPYLGQVAVGAVIMNRVKHPSFPNTIAGVIYQQGAFSPVANGTINNPPTDSARRAAQEALNGSDPTNGCIYFYNPAKTSNKYMLARPIVMTIGTHVFTK